MIKHLFSLFYCIVLKSIIIAVPWRLKVESASTLPTSTGAPACPHTLGGGIVCVLCSEIKITQLASTCTFDDLGGVDDWCGFDPRAAGQIVPGLVVAVPWYS